MRTRLVVVAVVLVVTGCGEDPSADKASSSTGTTTPAALATRLPEARALADVVGTQTFDTPGDADWVLVEDGIAWVANVEGGIARWDAATGKRVGTSGKGLDICTQMTVGDGSLWAADCGHDELVRVALADGSVQARIPLPSGVREEGSLAALPGAIYLASRATNELFRVDTATEEVVATIPVPQGVAGLRYGFGSLWASRPDVGTLERLDPNDGTVLASLEIGTGAYFLDVTDDAVWVMSNTDSEVAKVDPARDEVVATIDVSPDAVEGGDLTVGGSKVFARVSDVLVVVIDAATGKIEHRLGDAQGSGSADGDDTAVWISAHDAAKVYRVPLAP